MSFQPTLSDSEDLDLEIIVNRARIITTAQFYVKDKKEGLMEIGPMKQPPAKRKGFETKRKDRQRQSWLKSYQSRKCA